MLARLERKQGAESTQAVRRAIDEVTAEQEGKREGRAASGSSGEGKAASSSPKQGRRQRLRGRR